jgi:hypothetical protein
MQEIRRIATRLAQKLAEAHPAQFSAQCLLGHDDAKFLEHPLP